MRKNWRTTLCGILTIGGTVAATIASGGSFIAAIPAVLAGLGLIHASDAKVLTDAANKKNAPTVVK